jgi:hypothetical protein
MQPSQLRLNVSGGGNRESGCGAIGNRRGTFPWDSHASAASAAQQQKAERHRRIR